MPILRALKAKGGRARVADLYGPVEQQLDLNKWDYDYLEENDRPEPRWMNTMRVARDMMVKEEWLESLSVAGRGFWQIAEKGRKKLAEWAARTGQSPSWIAEAKIRTEAI
jgi:hypothetical protein